MNSAGYGAEGRPSKADAQIELIVSAWRQRGADVAAARLPDGSLDFLYRANEILVRNDSLDEVRRVLGGGNQSDAVAGHDRSLDGITRFSLAGVEFDTLAAVAAVDQALGPGIATPNHILSVCPVYACPATEPVPVPPGSQPDPGVCPGGGGGASIYVPDTGLLAGAPEAHSWLAGVTGEVDQLPPPDPYGVVTIPEYTGHGTFIAGVARCMAPAATVFVTSDFTTAGALSEFEVALRLNEALGLGVDIISLSAGGCTRRNLPLLSFESFWTRYRSYSGVQLVAAAGNNSSSRPFWPAAFPQVVGVGALAANGRARAYFSDFGPSVDVYAPGQDLVNAYASGTYHYREPPATGQDEVFYGMARWNGTSFATPLVAGLIAARMSRTGENARMAAVAMLAAARAQHVRGVGPVLLPCDTGDRGRDCSCGCGCGCGPRGH